MVERKNPVSSPLRYVFMLVLLLGLAAIVGGWLFETTGPGAVSIGLTVAVPILLMIGYVYAGYRYNPASLSTELFADSVYYLGFLFTLIALTVSLFSLTQSDTNTTGVVYRFGVALVTTVLGLGIRIYLTSFRFRSADDMARLEEQIGRSADSLRLRFDDLSTAMTLQQEAVKTSLDKGISDLADLGNAAKTSADDLEEAGQVLQDRLRRAALPMDLFLSHLRDPMLQLRTLVLDHNKEIRDWIERNRELGQKAEWTAQAFDEALESIRALAATSTDEFADTDSAAVRLTKTLDAVQVELASLGEISARYRQAIAHHAEAIYELGREMGGELTIARQHRIDLNEQLSDARSAVGRVHAELVQAAEFIRAELADR